MFMNPMLQPLITYNMPELLPIVEPIEESIDSPIVKPVVKPLNSFVICPVLTRSQGENTRSLSDLTTPFFSINYLQ